MRLLVSLSALALCSPGCRGGDGERPRAPNIVFIMMDDLGYGSLGAFGGDIRTPHIDRVAREGVALTQYYANGSVCSPTRVAVLSGRYPLRSGVRGLCMEGVNPYCALAAESLTVANVLQGAGYATKHVGKWHVGNALEGHQQSNRGFDEWITRRGGGSLYTDPPLEEHDAPPTVRAGNTTTLLTDSAIEFLRRPRDAPFFLNLWYHAPHKPVDGAPTRWRAAYPSSEAGGYSALVSHVDEQIGRILAVLDELDSRETFLVVTSDNGAYRVDGAFRGNGRLAKGKSFLFEGGIRVPAVARWPGRIPAGEISDAVVAGFDWFPTFAEAAGRDVSDLKLDGRSALPILSAPAQDLLPERTLFWERRSEDGSRHTLAIRRGAWKLIRRVAEGERTQEWLYDLETDPGESRNLAGSRPESVRELRDALTSWERDVSRIDVGVQDVEGGVTERESSWTFEGGTVILRPDTRFLAHLGDFAAHLEVRPEGAGRLATHPGSWSLALDRAGAVVLVLDGQPGLTLTSSTRLPRGQWTPVRFSMHGAVYGDNRIRLQVGDEILEGRIEAMAPSSSPVELGGGGTPSFVGEIRGLSFFRSSLRGGDPRALSGAGIPLFAGDRSESGSS